MTRNVLVDRDLVSRIESFGAATAVATTAQLAARWPDLGSATAERAGGAAIYMGPKLYVNRALGLGVAAAGGADDVDFVVDFYESRDATPEIELCPYADEAVREHAARRGFVPAWFRNVYVLPLDGWHAAALTGVPVKFVDVDERRYGDWEDAVVDAFGGDADVARRFAPARHATAGERDFLALVDGTVAGVCSMLVRDGIAELGGMGVLTSHRERGVQMACLAHRLRTAVEAGADLAVVTAMPGGSSARNVERAGFACVYTSVGIVRPRASG